MLSTSPKPLSAGQARTYHEREFASQKQNYWSRDRLGHSEWQGKLAEKRGLQGPVGNEEFARLTEGQHPLTGEQLVRHQPQKTYENQIGKEVTSVEHRAGWDGHLRAEVGLKTVKLNEIVRQRDPELKQTVEQLARGQVGEAIGGLARQGRIHEVQGHDERIAAIAKEYARSPESTLVVSPDNRSRAAINQGDSCGDAV